MESIKTYKFILMAVAGLVIVVGGAYYFIEGGHFKKSVQQIKAGERTVPFDGQVTRMYEGENKVVYSFNIPENATTTLGMDNALVRVEEGDKLFAAAYLSFEGGRGYMPEEYINRIIVPQVQALTVTGTTTIGSYTWTIAESANSEWHVAQVGDGQWLMVVENPKVNHDRVMGMMEGLQVK